MFSNNVFVSSNLQQVKQQNLLLKEPVHFWLAHYTNDYDVSFALRFIIIFDAVAKCCLWTLVKDCCILFHGQLHAQK